MTSRPRAGGVDALRALALLAVVVVNVAGYRELPQGGPLPALGAGAGPLDWGLTVLVASLLQGKGVALLTLLFGYSLALGRAGFARARLDRLLLLGLAHGLLLYCGDILSSYALAGYFALRWRRRRLRPLARRARAWTLGGALWLLLIWWAAAVLMPELAPDAERLAEAASLPAWWALNAGSYLSSLIGGLIAFLPMSYGLMLYGLLAGRLRAFQHRRWRHVWQRAARWLPLVLLLNLGYGLLYAQSLSRVGSLSLVPGAAFLIGPLSLLALVPWLLLRDWPAWLRAAGRNTLSVYLGSSLAAVLLWTQLRPPLGVAGAYLAAFAVWALLMVLAACFPRLPLEAWMARRKAAA